MPDIGLRELKAHISEIIRDVQENNTRYVVTKHGAPQALIIPYDPPEDVGEASREKAWNDLIDRLCQTTDKRS